MSRELECIIWCPSCKVDMFKVYRVTAKNPGVWVNKTEATEKGLACPNTKICTCGTNLERWARL